MNRQTWLSHPIVFFLEKQLKKPVLCHLKKKCAGHIVDEQIGTRFEGSVREAVKLGNEEFEAN